MTDSEKIYCELLTLRCRRREKEAFDELIGGWERRLFYYIRRLVDDEQEAWDILQETWLKVFRGITSLRNPASLSSWLYRIARNTAVSHLRKDRIEYERYQNGEYLPTDIEDNVQMSLEDVEELHRALKELSLPHREVLTLYFLEDFSIEEIAEILEVASGTVKSRIHYAKRALKTRLESMR